jgi:AraC-like DNA-binding protein
MDTLSDIIALLRPTAAISKPITASGSWGVRYAAHRMPGFAIVLAGQCWLAAGDQAPMALQRGDFILFPATPAFAMSSEPGGECVAATPSDRAVHHGDPGLPTDFAMLGGTFRIAPVNAPLLLALLPGMVHIPAATSTGRLARIVALIAEECGADHPGRDMVLHRLLEVMLVEALRWQGMGTTAPTGLLRGLRDPALARALSAMHAEIRAGWTVGSLAARAGMSRSAFAARFAQVLGCGPIEYLARWRMALAQDVLARDAPPLDRLAEDLGYESASAFSTAFRRRIGCAPGAFARSVRSEHREEVPA